MPSRIVRPHHRRNACRGRDRRAFSARWMVDAAREQARRCGQHQRQSKHLARIRIAMRWSARKK